MKTMDAQDSSFGMELAPGHRFGNYEIVRKLGEGGMGAVFEARRQGLNKRVALKVLTLGGNPAVTARFVQEARISASLEHPHVADCFDVGEVDGLPFLALEFLDGETLGARLERGPMTMTEIVDIALPVCSALAAAHQRNIVHRDLKPDNIFLARQAGAVVPKVLDFGIAKAANGNEPQGLTRTASIMGTPGYMSPEQAKDSKNVGAATDQFALGVILWEAVTGRALFYGDSALDVLMKVVSESAAPLRSLLPDLDPGYEAVVARLLEKDAANRLPTMREVGAALLPFASPECRTRWAPEFSGASEGAAAALARVSVAPNTGVPTIRDAVRPPTTPSLVTTRPKTLPPDRRHLGLAALAVVGLLGLSALAAWRLTHADAPSPVAAPQRVASQPPPTQAALAQPAPSQPAVRTPPAASPTRAAPAAQAPDDETPQPGRRGRAARRGRGRHRRRID